MFFPEAVEAQEFFIPLCGRKITVQPPVLVLCLARVHFRSLPGVAEKKAQLWKLKVTTIYSKDQQQVSTSEMEGVVPVGVEFFALN